MPKVQHARRWPGMARGWSGAIGEVLIYRIFSTVHVSLVACITLASRRPPGFQVVPARANISMYMQRC